MIFSRRVTVVTVTPHFRKSPIELSRRANNRKKPQTVTTVTPDLSVFEDFEGVQP